MGGVTGRESGHGGEVIAGGQEKNTGEVSPIGLRLGQRRESRALILSLKRP